jgi:hypothetical protein
MHHRSPLAVSFAPLLLTATMLAAPGDALAPNTRGSDGKIPFTRARLYIEFNATDEDIGVQVSLDGDPWKLLSVYDPRGVRITTIQNRGSLRVQGLTELFWESSEPPLEDLPLPVFFARFPEGTYEFEGLTIGGQEIEGEAEFTHIIPDAPEIIWPEKGVEQDPDNIDVCWKDVPDPEGSTIVAYQVTVTNSDTGNTFSVHVPAEVTSVSVPPEFIEPATEYEFEVLSIEAGGNQTITASAFTTMK